MLRTAQGRRKQVDGGPEKIRKEQSGISSPKSDLFPAPLERNLRLAVHWNSSGGSRGPALWPSPTLGTWGHASLHPGPWGVVPGVSGLGGRGWPSMKLLKEAPSVPTETKPRPLCEPVLDGFLTVSRQSRCKTCPGFVFFQQLRERQDAQAGLSLQSALRLVAWWPSPLSQGDSTTKRRGEGLFTESPCLNK